MVLGNYADSTVSRPRIVIISEFNPHPHPAASGMGVRWEEGDRSFFNWVRGNYLKHEPEIQSKAIALQATSPYSIHGTTCGPLSTDQG